LFPGLVILMQVIIPYIPWLANRIGDRAFALGKRLFFIFFFLIINWTPKRLVCGVCALRFLPFCGVFVAWVICMVLGSFFAYLCIPIIKQCIFFLFSSPLPLLLLNLYSLVWDYGLEDLVVWYPAPRCFNALGILLTYDCLVTTWTFMYRGGFRYSYCMLGVVSPYSEDYKFAVLGGHAIY